MKNVTVTIKLELEVPDDWELVETSDGVEMLRMGEAAYLDLTFEPMVANDIEGTWSNTVADEFMNSLLEMVVSEEISYTVATSPTH